MTYRVILKRSEEGYAVWCPALPGCASQGVTETEAIENIKSAIEEYLSVRDPLLAEDEMERVVEVD